MTDAAVTVEVTPPPEATPVAVIPEPSSGDTAALVASLAREVGELAAEVSGLRGTVADLIVKTEEAQNAAADAVAAAMQAPSVEQVEQIVETAIEEEPPVIEEPAPVEEEEPKEPPMIDHWYFRKSIRHES